MGIAKSGHLSTDEKEEEVDRKKDETKQLPFSQQSNCHPQGFGWLRW
jgi:hypothetical protein